MSKLYKEITNEQWPIIYRPEYNVHFLGLEKLHPFDSSKWGNIIEFLKRAEFITDETIVSPNETEKDDLLVVHSKKYLKSLKCSYKVAQIAEVPPLALVPNFLIQKAYLKPMRYQTGGSILGGKLAMERGWSINVGGGFHHCSHNKGGGFCPYADITLLIHFLFNNYPLQVKRVMIVDLDAHQGNGYQRDFIGEESVYIFDMYNKDIYPFDRVAKGAIRRRVELSTGAEDPEYLYKVEFNMEAALKEFFPSLIVYNAGTDILNGDPLGGLFISGRGIIMRDEIVFKKARDRGIPIVMLTSGGYQRKTARIIATSILNLYESKLINGPVTRY